MCSLFGRVLLAVPACAIVPGFVTICNCSAVFVLACAFPLCRSGFFRACAACPDLVRDPSARGGSACPVPAACGSVCPVPFSVVRHGSRFRPAFGVLAAFPASVPACLVWLLFCPFSRFLLPFVVFLALYKIGCISSILRLVCCLIF